MITESIIKDFIGAILYYFQIIFQLALIICIEYFPGALIKIVSCAKIASTLKR